jgi:hypothetical protein
MHRESKAGYGFDAFMISCWNLTRLDIFYKIYSDNQSKACIAKGISFSLNIGGSYQPDDPQIFCLGAQLLPQVSMYHAHAWERSASSTRARISSDSLNFSHFPVRGGWRLLPPAHLDPIETTTHLYDVQLRLREGNEHIQLNPFRPTAKLAGLPFPELFSMD